MGKERRFSTDAAHKIANVPFLKDRRAAHILNFMYSRKTKEKLLNKREIQTRAHDAPLFAVTVPRCEAFKRSVGYSGAIRWNELPPRIRNRNTYKQFKLSQKKAMLIPLDGIQIDL